MVLGLHLFNLQKFKVRSFIGKTLKILTKEYNIVGDQTNVMKTRSGRTISTIPVYPTRLPPPKAKVSPPRPPAEEWYKTLNRKIIKYRDMSYLSIVTRFLFLLYFCVANQNQLVSHLVNHSIMFQMQSGKRQGSTGSPWGPPSH